MSFYRVPRDFRRGSTEVLIGLAVFTAAGILAFLFQWMASQRLKQSVNQLNEVSGLYSGEVAVVSGYIRCFKGICADPFNSFQAVNLSYFDPPSPSGKLPSWAALFSGVASEATAGRNDPGVTPWTETRKFVTQKTILPRYRPGSVGLQRSSKVGGKTLYCGVTKSPRSEERVCLEIKEPAVISIKVGGAKSRTNYPPGSTNALTVNWTATNSTSCKVDAFSAPTTNPANKTPIPANSQGPTAPLPLPGGNSYPSAPFTLPRTIYSFELSCVSDIPAPVEIATVETGDYPPVSATFTVAAFNNPVAIKATAPGNTQLKLTWNSSGATECKMKSTVSRYCPPPPYNINGCDNSEQPFNDPAVASNGSGLAVAQNQSNQLTTALPQSRKVTYTLTCSNPQFSASASVFIQTYELVSVYRAFNPKAACHFFTDNQQEYNQITSGQGYWPEGERFKVFKEPWRDRVYPIYRLYNSKCHYYTINRGEKDLLVGSGAWQEEGTMGYAFDALNIPGNAPANTQPNPVPDPPIEKLALIYHLYNANSFGEGLSGDHIYVSSDAEAQAIINQSTSPPKPPEWNRQNPLGFLIPVNLPSPVYSKKPMYRFLLPSGYHFFTTNQAEGAPYVPENNDFCVYGDSINGNLSPLFRLRHPNGSHLLTPSRVVADTLTTPPDVWVYENIEGYVIPGTSFSGAVVRRFYQTSNGDQLYTANGALFLPPPWRLESDTFTGTFQMGGTCP